MKQNNTGKKIKEFSEWLEQFQLSEETKKIYLIMVGKFVSQYKKIIPETITEFLKNHPRQYSKSSIKYYLDYKDISDIKINQICKKIKKPKRKPKKAVKRNELKKIIDRIKNKINEDTKWILTLLYLTGARVVEILDMRPSDIDFQSCKITIRGAKGSLDGDYEFPEEFMKKLKKYLIKKKGLLSNERCFFTKMKGTRNSYWKLRREINKLDENEKKILLKTHVFRRAVINYILDVTNGNMMMAKAYARHKYGTSTQQYVDEWIEKKLRKEAMELVIKK